MSPSHDPEGDYTRAVDDIRGGLDVQECDNVLKECEEIIAMCKAAHQLGEEELRALECGHDQSQACAVDQCVEQRIDQLQLRFDSGKHSKGRARQRQRKGRKVQARRGAAESRSEQNRRRAQLGAAFERAVAMGAGMQPHEEFVSGSAAGTTRTLDEIDWHAILQQCAEGIRLCQLSCKIGDEQLEAVAAMAEARWREEQKWQEEQAQWEEEMTVSMPEPKPEPEPEPEPEWSEDWRVAAYEQRLRIATVSCVQRKGGGGHARRHRQSSTHRSSTDHISARQFKRQQAEAAEREVKQAAEMAADVERQAMWRARLAASRYIISADNRRGCRWEQQQQRRQHAVQEEQAVGINAAALGVDEATARLLRELQYREVRPEDYDLLGRLDENLEKPASRVCTLAQVGNFPLFTVGSDIAPHLVQDEAECGVCLCRIEEGEAMRQLPCCAHALFHDDCITKWLTETKNTCPACLHEYGSEA